MKVKYFRDYGLLNWIEPTQYYEDPWSYVGIGQDENDEEWDIVYNKDTYEYAYTMIWKIQITPPIFK